MSINYIKCHGSGNEFIMIDAVAQSLDGYNLSLLSQCVCSRATGSGADGVLLLVKDKEGVYGMRMFNPDGSEAEMCGNGIRCVARLAEKYIQSSEFILTSGGKRYPIKRQPSIYSTIPTYGVQIAVELWSSDFAFFAKDDKRFIGKIIPQLHPTLCWSAISVGNPHIIAHVEKCDITLLESLGERVKSLTDILPKGVNISFVETLGRNHIFVTTFERGAGITPSCGTAMTSSATAMALLGLAEYNTEILVENRGGAVKCNCSTEGSLHTTLTGNASYIEHGVIEFDGKTFATKTSSVCTEEIVLWNNFLASRVEK